MCIRDRLYNDSMTMLPGDDTGIYRHHYNTAFQFRAGISHNDIMSHELLYTDCTGAPK